MGCKVGFSNFVKWYPRSEPHQQTRYNKISNRPFYWKQLAQSKGFSQFSIQIGWMWKLWSKGRSYQTSMPCGVQASIPASFWNSGSQPFTNVNSVVKVSLPISWCLCMSPFCVTVATLPNSSANKRKKRSILFLDLRSIVFHTKTLRSTFHSERKIDKTHYSRSQVGKQGNQRKHTNIHPLE